MAIATSGSSTVVINNVSTQVSTVQTTVTNIQTLLQHSRYILDLWSPYLTQIVVTTVPGAIALPAITIAGISAGATVQRAIMMFKFRTLENTNAAVNNVAGAQNIQAERAVGGAWIAGIALVGGEMSVAATTRETGDVLMGTNDIAAQVPANGAVINFRWAAALAAQNNLNFNDIQIGLRIWFS